MAEINYEISQLSIKFQSNYYQDNNKIEELKSSFVLYTEPPNYDVGKSFSGLNQYPYFCYYVPYSDRILEFLPTYKEVVETFFILSKFKTFITQCYNRNQKNIGMPLSEYKTKYNHFSEKNDEHNRNTAYENIKIMLRWLFPMSFPVKRQFKERKQMDRLAENLNDDSISRKLQDIGLTASAYLSNSNDIIASLNKKFSYLKLGGTNCTVIYGEWKSHVFSNPLYSVELKIKTEQYQNSMKSILQNNLIPKLKELFAEVQRFNNLLSFNDDDNFLTFMTSNFNANENIDALLDKLSIKDFSEYKKTLLKFNELLSEMKSRRGGTTQIVPTINMTNAFSQLHGPRTGRIGNNHNETNIKTIETLKKYISVLFFLNHPVYNIQKIIMKYSTEIGFNSSFFSGTVYAKYIEYCDYLNKNFLNRAIHSDANFVSIFTPIKIENYIFDEKYFDFKRYLNVFDNKTNYYLGIDSINTNLKAVDLKTNPSYEIYLRLDVVGGIISKQIMDAALCPYNSNRLGYMYQTIYNMYGNINTNQVQIQNPYFDITSILSNLKNPKKQKSDMKPINEPTDNDNKQTSKTLSITDSSPSSTTNASNIDDIISLYSTGINPANIDDFFKTLKNEYGSLLKNISPDYTTHAIGDSVSSAIAEANVKKENANRRLSDPNITTDQSIKYKYETQLYSDIIKFFNNIALAESKKMVKTGGKRYKRKTRKQKKRLSRKTKKHRNQRQ